MAGIRSRQPKRSDYFEQPSPENVGEVEAPLPRSYEPSHLLQAMMGVTQSVGTLSAKVDRLITDYGKQEDELKTIRESLIRAKALLTAIAFIVPVCLSIIGGILWFVLGDKIEALRDQIMERPFQEAPAKPISAPVVPKKP